MYASHKLFFFSPRSVTKSIKQAIIGEHNQLKPPANTKLHCLLTYRDPNNHQNQSSTKAKQYKSKAVQEHPQPSARVRGSLTRPSSTILQPKQGLKTVRLTKPQPRHRDLQVSARSASHTLCSHRSLPRSKIETNPESVDQ